MRIGLEDGKEYSLAAVAMELGIGIERVRQIQNKAFCKIREAGFLTGSRVVVDGWLGGDFAREAGDQFAQMHDDFSQSFPNTRWTHNLLRCAEAVGLDRNKDHLLDIGCGTGLSVIPMLRRGWAVTAVDISTEMLEVARSKIGDLASFRRADVRELPDLGSFDLVWAIDTLNYLLTADELVAALVGMTRQLAPGGVVVFDTNTLATYETLFTEEVEIKVKNRRLKWTGRATPETVHPEMIAEARLEAIGEAGSVHVHRQRHFPESLAREAIEAAGLSCVDVGGALEVDLCRPLDESVHKRAAYICVACT